MGIKTMYFPYFRGKQYDLITIRENATLLAEKNFIPIVEPVKQILNGLAKTIDAITSAKGQLILIVNPSNGDHSEDFNSLNDFLLNTYKDHLNIQIGVLLDSSITIAEIQKICAPFISNRKIALIHNGFSDHKDLNSYIDSNEIDCMHIFIDGVCGKLYRKHFRGGFRVLIRDGFEKRANRAHPEVEPFSELHLTYPEEGMDGFGDFLITGNEYSETGGPAYAVAIHITYLNSDDENMMYIHHFKSDRNDTPTDPAGKFAEALVKLEREVSSPETCVLKSKAICEFLELKSRGHFPGLGYVKKLSMQHHIETMADFFSEGV